MYVPWECITLNRCYCSKNRTAAVKQILYASICTYTELQTYLHAVCVCVCICVSVFFIAGSVCTWCHVPACSVYNCRYMYVNELED